MAGLSTNGFTLQTLPQLIADINQRFQAQFGNAFDVSADGPAGQLIGTNAAKLSELWELAAAIYASQDPAQASGAAFDQILALTGVTRLPATHSTATVTLTGTGSTVIPAGTTYSVSGTGAKFTQNVTVTLVAGAGTAAVTAVDFGPVLAPAGTLTVIETPVGGLTSITNAADAIAGTNVETDAAARVRRLALLRNAGLSTVDSIRAKVLGVANVTQAIVYENTTTVTDTNGTPPNAFQTFVQGGLDADIETAVFAAKPAGIQAYGTTSGSVNDSYGNPHTVGFSRAVSVPIYITVNLTYNHAVGVYAGDAAVKQAIANYGNTFLLGQSVVRSLLYGAIEGVTGILDVTAITLGTAPAPVGTANIAITPTQLATFRCFLTLL